MLIRTQWRQWKRDWQTLVRFVWPYRGRMVLLIGMMLLVGVTNAGVAEIIKWVMDRLIIALDFGMLPWLLLGVTALYATRAFFMYRSTAMSRWIGAQVAFETRGRLVRHVLHQPPEFFRAFPAGHVTSRITHDGFVLGQGLTDVMINVFLEGFKAFAMVVYIFWLNWRLALFAVLVIPLVLVPVVFIGHRIRRLTDRFQHQLGNLTHTFYQVLRGLRIVQAYQGESREITRFQERNRAMLGIERRLVFWTALHAPLIEVCLGAMLVALIVYGAVQIRRETLTPGGFTAFIAAMLITYTPLRRLSRMNALLQQTVTAAERLEALLQFDMRLPEDPYPIRLPQLRGRIRFERVTYRYPDKDRPALIDVSFEVEPGEIVAIVGPSGAGKSTLAQLIPRFMDVSDGAVYVDDWDVRRVRLQDLRAHIAWVPQDVFLLEDTVYNNIAYGREHATEADVLRAAHQAHAHGFIVELPRGYETVIGGDTLALSGGQAQRIALARALIKCPAILILDEVTSALDSESEAHIRDALEELRGQCTILLISHRWTMLQLADRIFVLDEGQLVDQGTHEDLLTRCALYRRLWRYAVTPIGP